MIIPDLNLIVYAYDTRSPFHAVARRWWLGLMNGPDQVGFPHVVLFGLMRVMTKRLIVATPLGPTALRTEIDAWLERPNVRLLEPTPGHLGRVFDLLEQVGTAGDLTTDAQIAAFALEYNAVVHSADNDFARFKGLRWSNPLDD